MNEKVFETINKYSSSYMFLPPETIEEIISLLASDMELNDYVKSISFYDPDASTSFNPFKRKLVFDYNWHNGDKYNSMYIHNLLYLFEILHELTHASQLKLINEKTIDDMNRPLDKYKYLLTNDFYTYCKLKERNMVHYVSSLDDLRFANYICKNKDNDYPATLGFFYFLFHDNFICEREADVEAYKYIIALLKTYDSNSKCIQYFENKLRDRCLKSYSYRYGELTYTPLKAYLENFGYDELNTSLDSLKSEITEKQREIPLVDKMEYGLDITEDEFNNINNYNDDKRFSKRLRKHNIIIK